MLGLPRDQGFNAIALLHELLVNVCECVSCARSLEGGKVDYLPSQLDVVHTASGHAAKVGR